MSKTRCYEPDPWDDRDCYDAAGRYCGPDDPTPDDYPGQVDFDPPDEYDPTDADIDAATDRYFAHLWR
jgi:hypothetical protein